MNVQDADFGLICSNFLSEDPPETTERVQTGHINTAFRIVTESQHAYFLQKINENIFRDVDALMQNIERVTLHLERKSPSDPDALPGILHLVKTHDNGLYFRDPQGHAWRMFNFLENTHTVDRVTEPDQAREGGLAFGKFLMAFDGFDARLLHTTLPRFHDLDYRMEQYEEACARDVAGRLAEVFGEVRFVKETAPDMAKFWHLISDAHVPVRITHNDTKFNNILLSPEDKAVCIVDLDTVMPGSMLFDFGDAIRTLSNTADEDESDLRRVGFNRALYQAFTESYLAQCHSTLTRLEMIHMPYSALYMTFLIGLRFLTDYINGDVYYRTRHPRHNLDRARVQFRLMSEMQENLNFMKQF